MAWLGLLAALAALSSASAAHAQCTEAPRIVVSDRSCTLGEPCEVTIALETGGEDIASFAGRLESAASFTCDASCAPGSAAANGGCSVNSSNCAFNVADLSPPITAFVDGPGAILTVTCNTPGANAFTLANVTFGDTTGIPVAGCGAGGTITCEDLCDGVDCDDSNPCTVDACDPGDGSCSNDPVANGTACTDDLNECTDDVCASGVCTHPANSDPCDDGLACTTGDACSAGACTGADTCPAGEFCDGESGACAAAEPEALVAVTKDKGLNASTFNAGGFLVENRSTGGIRITQVVLDLESSLFPDMVFDPSGVAGDILAKCLDPESGEAETGFVEPGDLCDDPFASEHDDGFFQLTIDFDDFDPAEAFGFRVDVDPTSIRGAGGSGAAGAVSGLELTGAVVTVHFDDGSTVVSELFRQAGSNGGGLNIVKPNPPAAPSLDALGIAEPAVTDDATQTIRVTGPAGASVRLLRIEGALLLEDAPGFDLDPFEANTAVAVQEIAAVIGGGGFVDVPVVLTRDSNLGGLNYFAASIVDPDGSGRTGAVSNVVVLSLGETCQDDASCDDGDPCTAEVCDEDEGCVRGDAPAGTPCGSDLNPCTDDVCDGDGGCTHPNNSEPCDDGLFCNGADTCAAGACTVHAGDPCTGADQCDEAGNRCAECLSDPDCAGLGDECNVGKCDLAAGTCFAQPKPDGTACSDDLNACTDDVCDAGACSHPNNSAPCDDGLFCNGDDTCADGTCSSHAGDPCAERCDETNDVCEDLECTSNADCAGLTDDCNTGVCDLGPGTCSAQPKTAGTACEDDANVCTNDVCDGAGACVHEPNAASCDDGLFCNGADTCAAGTCSQHAGDPCAERCDEAGDQCIDLECMDDAECAHLSTDCATGRCDLDSGTCFAEAAAASTPCTDDANVCTDDVCDGAGACVHEPNAAPCDDGLFCNGADACDGGSCSLHAGDPCAGPDGDANCAESCDETAGACTGPDPAGAVCAEDGNPCTDDRCDGAGACVPLDNSEPCDDGNFCTSNDVCSDGACVGTGDPCEGRGCDEAGDQCVDCASDEHCAAFADACNDGKCDVEAGSCSAVPKGDGTPCDDLAFCTVEDACVAGVCDGQARNCGDGIPCTADACDDAADQCAHLPIHGVCDDGEACTGEETCVPGEGCVSAGPPDCSELDDTCAVGTCDEAAGGCVALPAGDGEVCEDGNACTIEDACAAGACTGVSFCGVPLSRGVSPTVTDALFILRTAVVLETCDACECDVNSDGRVTTTDALLTLQVVVELPATLECFAPVDEPTSTSTVPVSTSTTTTFPATTTTTLLEP